MAVAAAIGFPLGVLSHRNENLRSAVLPILSFLQTIPSLAMFGIMIPILAWVGTTVPGARELGVAGIGFLPAFLALVIYSLLPVVANTVAGLEAAPPAAMDAARGMGMTRNQRLLQVQLPLGLPVMLAGIRIVLVQNIGLAVIAGLIGGGGFGTFVFQGLNQTATDLILLGALPTVALALISAITMDILVELAQPNTMRHQ
ncbi:Glycine betaine/carnitine/choline transport system permease protein OpuCD [Pseudovibrio sp. FO-BEG1]|nr:Glycine betaine/carnitine/choline transport system permease protein OpuCD [Pseudovibrio sp. FO-BEG1]